jgi:hypothetical protein
MPHMRAVGSKAGPPKPNGEQGSEWCMKVSARAGPSKNRSVVCDYRHLPAIAPGQHACQIELILAACSLTFWRAVDDNA